MHRILLIETSTSLCSVAIAADGKVIASRESREERAHAAMTAPFIKEVLAECAMDAKDLDAVCVSSGPGSYTGLRVGSSSAKGLCFGSGLPLIAIRTPEILADMAVTEGLLPKGCIRIVPMIDARRMEVYCAPFSFSGDPSDSPVLAGEISPLVVEADCFGPILSEGPVLFIGDGAAKCSGVITSENAHFAQVNPHAAGMARLAERAFCEKRFKDTAYFEPFYLKEFVATVSRKKLF